MKMVCKLIMGLLVVVWVCGCGEKKAVNTNEAKPAEPVTQSKGTAPASQAQQSMAIGQIVDKAASQSDAKAGRKAAASIDKINAMRKSEE